MMWKEATWNWLKLSVLEVENLKPSKMNFDEFTDFFTVKGFPQLHQFPDVTNIKFDGCIDNITITGEPVDLRNNIKSFGVTPGCPAKVRKSNC